MKRDLGKVPMLDRPLYTEAVEAMKVYHDAEADGVVGIELERKGSIIPTFQAPT